MYKVINKFDDSEVGDVVELNDRRAKSELRSKNVEVYVAPVKKAVKKPKKKTKEQKFK